MTWLKSGKGTIGLSLAVLFSIGVLAGPGSTRNIVGDQITSSTGNVMDVQDAADVLVGRDTTDTLTNKTLTAPAINSPRLDGETASSTSRWTLPAAVTATLASVLTETGDLAYDTTLGKPVYFDGSDVVEIGSGSGGGSGGVNYLTNSDFETDTTGVSSYDDSGAYVDGDGGSPSAITFAITSSSDILEGTQSLKISKAASDASGEGITLLTAAVDPDYRGSELVFTLSHDGGTANYNGSDISVFAYDVTGTVILPVKALNYTDGQGTTSILSGGSIQKFAVKTGDATGTVRLSLHIESDSVTGSAWDLVVDRVSFSPQDPIVVGNIGGETAYTPTFTGFGTPSSVNFWYRQVGDRLEIRGNFVTGTTTATPGLISLPSGFTIDTARINTTADVETFGVGTQPTGGGASNWVADSTAQKVTAFFDGTNVDSFEISNQGATDTNNSRLANALWAAGERMIFSSISIPIANASSNLAVGTAGTFKISKLLSTRVTATPTKLGEYRSKYKAINSNNYGAWTDTAPTTAPSAANGILIYADPYDVAGTANQVNAYEIFIGKGKEGLYRVTAYEGTGKSGEIDSTYYSDGTESFGIAKSYDNSTGVLVISAGTHPSGVTGNSFLGRAILDAGVPTSGYAEVTISNNVQAIALEGNTIQTKTLSANITSSTNPITDLTFSNLVIGKLYELHLSGQMIGSDETSYLYAIHDSVNIIWLSMNSGNTNADRVTVTDTVPFIATATTLTFNFSELSVSTTLEGNGTTQETHATLKALNNYRQVTNH